MYYAKTEATMNLDDLKAYKLVRKVFLMLISPALLRYLLSDNNKPVIVS